MFFNVSNHPHEKWGERQLEEARRLGGEIVDIPFPNVSPTLDTEELEDLVYSVIKQVHEKRDGKQDVALVQGEHTLTFLLVNKLAELGVVPVAATSERRVTETPQGKVSVFEFCKFRRYPF
jgi:hypothetical protein